MLFEVSIWSAALAGFLTFFAPCTLPLVPAYLAFLGGAAGTTHGRRHLVFHALLFVLGFTVVFTLLGAGAGFLGDLLHTYRFVGYRVGGLFIILFGFMLLGFIRIPVFQGIQGLPRWLPKGTELGALLFGIIFALGWTPCLGAVLGSILVVAGSSADTWNGALLLAVFAIGHGIPFVIVSLFANRFYGFIARSHKWLRIVNWVMGLLLIVIGALFLFGSIGTIMEIGMWFIPNAFYESLMDYL